MKIFNCILGIFSVFGSIYCMFFPGITFLNSGWIVTILLGVIGICCIFEYAANPEKKNGDKKLIINGIAGLIFGIAAAVVSTLAMFMPAIRLIIDMIILVLFAVWLIYSGIMSVAKAISLKKKGIGSWILTLILGIIVAITGIYGLFNLMVTVFTIGYVIGMVLMVYGIRLITSVFEKDN